VRNPFERPVRFDGCAIWDPHRPLLEATGPGYGALDRRPRKSTFLRFIWNGVRDQARRAPTQEKVSEMIPRDDRPPQDDEVAFDASLERKREARKSGSKAEVRQRRDADFPEALQGRWVDAEVADTELIIQGGRIL
jgi:hypothetical protein